MQISPDVVHQVDRDQRPADAAPTGKADDAVQVPVGPPQRVSHAPPPVGRLRAARHSAFEALRSLRITLKSKREFVGRAISFWRIYGFQEFAKETLKYLRAHYRLSTPARLGASNALLSGERINPIATPACHVFSLPYVVVIGELSLPQCKKYRVLQKLEILADLGIDYGYADWRDGHRCMNFLQMATTAIFYRCPESEEFKVYIRECQRLGITTIYDIDDPIFSRSIYQKNVNLGHLHTAERENLINGSDLYLNALKHCEYTSGSTPRLCKELEKLTGAEAFLWRNLVDMESLDAARFALQAKPAVQDHVTLVYASGSRAHEADFRSIERCITALMNANPDLRLKIIGFLELPLTLAPYKDRINQHPFSHYYDYMTTLAQADICIIPLVDDDFNDCKSAIRYLEASLLKLPSVVSKVGDYVGLIEHGKTGFLAATDDEWLQHTQALIDVSHLRSAIANAAQRRVYESYTTSAWKNAASPILFDLIALQDVK